MGLPAAIMIGAVVAGGATLASSMMQGSAQEEAREQSMQVYQEEKASVEQAKKEEQDRQAKEEERLKPWREAQTSALEYYRGMAENPEISDLTRIRLEEEDKAINRELASQGLLFSGPAAELRQKSRERIIAEETESAKSMLKDVMSATPPGEGLMPGTAQYDALLAGLKPKDFGTGGASSYASGLTGLGNTALAAGNAYLGYKGAQDITGAIKSMYPQNNNYSNYNQGYYGQTGLYDIFNY